MADHLREPVLILKGPMPAEAAAIPNPSSTACQGGAELIASPNRGLSRRDRGVSSVGRALRSHRRGQGFESPILHFFLFLAHGLRGLAFLGRRDWTGSIPVTRSSHASNPLGMVFLMAVARNQETAQGKK